MLLFHEGLPRSGKSYEAMVRHIIPSLQAGRKVFAHLDGPDPANPDCPFIKRIAEASGLPVERVRELYHPVSAEQMPTVYDVVEDNAFVVLDEAQNFWVSGREKLSPQMMKFITEHGHRGLDILLMGQDIRDVHAIWRRRVSQKVTFHKLDAVGQENRYNVTVFKATAPEKFEKVNTALGVYDPKYFGTYASHVAHSISTANYVDPRANIKNTFFVRWGLPLTGAALVFGCFYTWKFFHPVAKEQPAAEAAPVERPQPRAVPQPVVSKVKPFIEQLNEKYRARLAVMYLRDGQQFGWVEWWDGDAVREKLSFKEIVAMGATVEVRDTLVKVAGAWVTPWPLRTKVTDPKTPTAPTESAGSGGIGGALFGKS